METALIITGTPESIADGLTQFAERHKPAPKPKSDFQSDKMTVEQAGRFAGTCYKIMCKRIREGKIRCYGTGRTRFVLRSELIDDLKAME